MDVAICGMGERELPESMELWGMSWDQDWVKMDMLFDMHDPAIMDDDIVKRNQEVWMPLIMQDEYYPNATAYPFDDVIKLGADYFTCSTAYMMGMAILEDIAEIHLHGITGAEDYARQRPCIEYWMGIAKGRGIDVHVHGDSELMKAERYGFKTL